MRKIFVALAVGLPLALSVVFITNSVSTDNFPMFGPSIIDETQDFQQTYQAGLDYCEQNYGGIGTLDNLESYEKCINSVEEWYAKKISITRYIGIKAALIPKLCRVTNIAANATKIIPIQIILLLICNVFSEFIIILFAFIADAKGRHRPVHQFAHKGHIHAGIDAARQEDAKGHIRHHTPGNRLS